MNTALLIIDVQVGAFNGGRIPPIKNSSKLLDNIKKILLHSRKNNLRIIYVQDCGHKGGAFEKGSVHWSIHSHIKPLDDEIIIEKYHGDSFEKTNLKRELDNNGIENLIVTGIHSDKCAASTVLAGIASGYSITIASDALGSDKKKSEEIVVDQNLVFKRSGCAVLSTEEIIRLNQVDR